MFRPKFVQCVHLIGVLLLVNESTADETNGCSRNTEKYLLGALSVFIIWLCSFSAVLAVGLFHKKFQAKLFILILRGLAIGTLLTDVFLHIIPTILGNHSHSEEESESTEDEEKKKERENIGKMSLIFATILLFLLLDSFFAHDHSHDEENAKNNHEHSHALNVSQDVEASNHNLNNVNTSRELLDQQNKNLSNNSAQKSVLERFLRYLKSIKPNGWIAFCGDLLHKIADGLAIGASYSESTSLGVSTSLAILFHEIPHEIGDYAVLEESGFNLPTILVLNTFTSFSSLIAFFILASVSPNEQVRQWIFSVIAGVFIYIALVIMTPMMKKVFRIDESNKRRSWVTIFVVLGFFLLGFLIMFLLAFFEDDIKININSSC